MHEGDGVGDIYRALIEILRLKEFVKLRNGVEMLITVYMFVPEGQRINKK